MEDEKAVVIAGTTYSMVEPPGGDTQIVMEQRGKLLAKIELKTLVSDLCNVGSFVRLAYYGLVAAGPDLTHMQLEVQGLGYDVTKLCDKSAITVSKFKRASSTIVTDLQATYEYLLDNLEEMALDTLASVSELAGQMAAAAKTLQHDFDEEAQKVREVAERATRAKDETQKQADATKAKREAKEKEREDHKEVLGKAKEAEEEAEEKYFLYELKENEAIESLGEEAGTLRRLGNAFTSLLGKDYLREQRKTKERLLDEWKTKKKEALVRRKEMEEQRQEAYQTMSDLTEEIQNCKDVKNMAQKTVDALHQATEGLRMLAALMMHTARFWEQLQDHCKSLGEDEVKKRVEKAMTYDDAKRRRVWTSKGFKLQAVRFYAGWVALDGVCEDYMLSIREAQRELYQYITENPSYEEAEENVHILAREFSKRLQAEQKAIDEGKTKTEEEMRALDEVEEEQ